MDNTKVTITRDSTDASDEIKFTDTNSFSIRCGKCADVHNAQLDGKTSDPCKCDCHDKLDIPRYVPYCPPDPCCPVYPQPYWSFTGGTADPFPNRGYTFCSTHDQYNPSAGGCNCYQLDFNQYVLGEQGIN